VRRAALAGLLLTLGTQALSGLGLLLGHDHLAALYTRDAAVAALAGTLLLYAMAFQFPDGVQVLSAGALRGLQRYLELSREKDAAILPDFLKMLQTTKEPAVRIQVIRVIEILMRNIGQSSNASLTGTKTVLKAMLKDGSDEEAVMSVRLLLRMLDADVVETILEAARPGEKPRFLPETYIKLSQALAAAMTQLRATAKKQETLAAVKNIQAHFFWILDPKTKAGPLRQTAILAFRDWPIEFDREEIVQSLIQLLIYSIDKDKDMVGEIEETLRFLTMQQFRKTENKAYIPDTDAWQKWLDDNKDKLKPDKTPW